MFLKVVVAITRHDNRLCDEPKNDNTNKTLQR